MAIKIIKFDLPINGTKVTTLEALRDNLTDEIVPLARSGQLERWFKSRQLQEHAQAVAAAVSQHAKDKALFLALCEVLEVEVHPDDASAIFDAPPEAGRHAKNDRNHLLAIIHEQEETIKNHKNEVSRFAIEIENIVNSQHTRMKYANLSDSKVLMEEYFKNKEELRILVSEIYRLLPSFKKEILYSFASLWNRA